jgi:hypothetical protein
VCPGLERALQLNITSISSCVVRVSDFWIRALDLSLATAVRVTLNGSLAFTESSEFTFVAFCCAIAPSFITESFTPLGSPSIDNRTQHCAHYTTQYRTIDHLVDTCCTDNRHLAAKPVTRLLGFDYKPTRMSLPPRRLATTIVTHDSGADATIAVVGGIAALVLVPIYIATQLDFEDGLSAGYMLFVLVAAMGLFCPEDHPTRVRPIAIGILMVAGVSVAVGLGVVGCVVVGWVHWIELIILLPPFLLAAVLLRVACRKLRRRVDDLQEKHYTLPSQAHKPACPICGFKDGPKTSHELWEPVYDARHGIYRPGMLYSYAFQEYECAFAASGECNDGPFEQPRDVAEHMLNVHWGDGFHCPGCLRSLRGVRCGGGCGGWGL